MARKPSKKISSLEELKEKARCGLDCHLLLKNGGSSSKFIHYFHDTKKYFIINLIDDSEQLLTERQLMDERITNIGVALKNGVLFED